MHPACGFGEELPGELGYPRGISERRDFSGNFPCEHRPLKTFPSPILVPVRRTPAHLCCDLQQTLEWNSKHFGSILPGSPLSLAGFRVVHACTDKSKVLVYGQSAPRLRIEVLILKVFVILRPRFRQFFPRERADTALLIITLQLVARASFPVVGHLVFHVRDVLSGHPHCNSVGIRWNAGLSSRRVAPDSYPTSSNDATRQYVAKSFSQASRPSGTAEFAGLGNGAQYRRRRVEWQNVFRRDSG